MKKQPFYTEEQIKDAADIADLLCEANLKAARHLQHLPYWNVSLQASIRVAKQIDLLKAELDTLIRWLELLKTEAQQRYVGKIVVQIGLLCDCQPPSTEQPDLDRQMEFSGAVCDKLWPAVDELTDAVCNAKQRLFARRLNTASCTIRLYRALDRLERSANRESRFLQSLTCSEPASISVETDFSDKCSRCGRTATDFADKEGTDNKNEKHSSP